MVYIDWSLSNFLTLQHPAGKKLSLATHFSALLCRTWKDHDYTVPFSLKTWFCWSLCKAVALTLMLPQGSWLNPTLPLPKKKKKHWKNVENLGFGQGSEKSQVWIVDRSMSVTLCT